MALPRPTPEVQLPAQPLPVQYSSLAGSLLTPEIVALLAGGSIVAIQKALDSGVKEYAIGSRSLNRYELEQLLKVLQFASNAAAAVSPDGTTSAIQSRRGVPTDT
jgi:hypothetical protein